MSDSDRDQVTPRTSGSAARGTEGGGGEPPADLPERGDDAGGDRMTKAQRDMSSGDVDNPIEGEGTTEEGRRQAIATAAGPEATEAAPGPSTSRGPGRDEPDPGAVSGE